MKTIIRFKLFRIKIIDGQITFDPTFDASMAGLQSAQEKPILDQIQEEYRLLRIIPDELPNYFWGIDGKQAGKEYIKNFKELSPNDEFYLMSEFLKKPKLKSIYDQVFDKVYKSDPIDPEMFKLEVNRRSTYYTTTPLPITKSQELAKKAFALFAAEMAVLYELQQQGFFPNITLLGRQDLLDDYKYEFYKFPKGRPVFPKLYVI